VSVLRRIFLCLATAVASIAQADTNDIELQHGQSPIIPGLEAKEPTDFVSRWHAAYDERTEEVFTDRLHPLKVMEISLKNPGGTREDIVERNDRAVKGAFIKSFEYSLRDASFGLPVMNWLESSQDAFGSFLHDSVDAVEEESVSPFSLSSGQAERTWWQSLATKRPYRFGLRPFRTSPYAYLALRLKEAGQTVLMGNLRYYLQNFSDHRFELSFSIPMPGGMAFDVGTYYQFGLHEEQHRMVAKIFKPLTHGGMLHLGVEVQRNPLIFAGITMPL
jgi:hypothetical protein